MAVLTPAALPLVGARPRIPSAVRIPGPVLTALALVAAFVVALAGSVAIGRPGTPAPRAVTAPAVAESAAYPAWTVQSGDTLWSIARAVVPQADPRAVVLQLQVLNDLAPGHVLQIGEVLQLPPAGS